MKKAFIYIPAVFAVAYLSVILLRSQEPSTPGGIQEDSQQTNAGVIMGWKEADVVFPWNIDDIEFSVDFIGELTRRAMEAEDPSKHLHDLFYLDLISDTSRASAVSYAIEQIRDKIGYAAFHEIVRREPIYRRKRLLPFYERHESIRSEQSASAGEAQNGSPRSDAGAVFPWRTDGKEFARLVADLTRQSMEPDDTSGSLVDLFYLHALYNKVPDKGGRYNDIENSIKQVRDKIGIDSFYEIVKTQPYPLRENLLIFYEKQIDWN